MKAAKEAFSDWLFWEGSADPAHTTNTVNDMRAAFVAGAKWGAQEGAREALVRLREYSMDDDATVPDGDRCAKVLADVEREASQ